MQLIKYFHLTEYTRWKRIFSTSAPEIVIGVGLTRPLLKAARDLGIKTIEVQHGTITRETTWRNWFSKFDNVYHSPDIYLGWDEFFRHAFEGTQIDFQVMGGFRSCYTSSSKNEIYDFLYCLTYKSFGIFNYCVVNKEFLLHMQKYRNSRVLIKMHPLTYRKTDLLIISCYLRFIGIDFDIAANMTFDKVIGLTKNIVSIPSSTFWEASFAGKGIISIGVPSSEYFSETIIQTCTII